MPHRSVLLNDVLRWLDPKPGEIMVDGTLGCAGHAREILKRISSDGRLIGFDRDSEAIEESKRHLGGFGEQVMIIHENFKNIPSRLESLSQRADGILLDLGVSSPQLDEARRGFSFKGDGPLDMRMDASESLTAKEVVNTYSEQALADIFWKYGEERYSRRIAERINEARRTRKITSTKELESLIWMSVPAACRHGRIHPATRVFQALRIEVNQEMEALDIFLSGALAALNPRGRLVIISFHSLEDRKVKQSFRQFEKDGWGRVLTKKPVVADPDEVQENPRSRSAKLRAFQKH